MTEAMKRGRGRPRKHPLPELEELRPGDFITKTYPLPEVLPPPVKTTSLRELNPADPSKIGLWPKTLPIEIALQTGPIDKLIAAYKLSEDDWLALSANPDFIAECDHYREQLKTEGMSFKMKARLQAEEILKTSWKLIHDPDTPAPQKADLIKTTFRVAGYDSKEGAGVGNAVGLSINLILGDK